MSDQTLFIILISFSLLIFILRPCLFNHFTLQSYFRHLDFLSTALSKFRLGQCKYFLRLLLFPSFVCLRPGQTNKGWIRQYPWVSYRLIDFDISKKNKSCWLLKISISISCVFVPNEYNMYLLQLQTGYIQSGKILLSMAIRKNVKLNSKQHILSSYQQSLSLFGWLLKFF